MELKDELVEQIEDLKKQAENPLHGVESLHLREEGLVVQVAEESITWS